MKDDDISHENLSVWIDKQIEEILGKNNRDFFRNAHGREPENDNELALHYIKNGGAIDFDKRNEKNKK